MNWYECVAWKWANLHEMLCQFCKLIKDSCFQKFNSIWSTATSLLPFEPIQVPMAIEQISWFFFCFLLQIASLSLMISMEYIGNASLVEGNNKWCHFTVHTKYDSNERRQSKNEHWSRFHVMPLIRYHLWYCSSWWTQRTDRLSCFNSILDLKQRQIYECVWVYPRSRNVSKKTESFNWNSRWRKKEMIIN